MSTEYRDGMYATFSETGAKEKNTRVKRKKQDTTEVLGANLGLH